MIERPNGEDGAVAVMVAILLVVFVGVGALAVDLGSAWETKRDVVTDTDAGALAGARMLARLGRANCGATATQAAVRTEAAAVVTLNDASTTLNSPPEIECLGSYAVVRVDGRRTAQETFTGPAGGSDLAASSESAAVAGPTIQASGLLPLAFCNQIPAISGYLSGGERDISRRGESERYPAETFDGQSYAGMGAGLVHKIDWTKQHEGDCGQATGNWGWQGFHNKNLGSSTCSNGSDLDDLRAMICRGYGGDVSLGEGNTNDGRHCGIVDPADIKNSDEKPKGVCWGSSGDPDAGHAQLRASWLCQASTEICIAQGKVFTVMVFDQALDRSGTTAKFQPIAFLGVILRDNDKLNPGGGEGGGGGAYWSMHLEFTNSQVEGRVGQVAFDTGVSSYELCGADGLENCTP
jgi:Flp pilus assembly protein TadG